MTIQINVRELLAFNDEHREARPHSNSIKTLAGEEIGLASLVKYFKDKGLETQILPERCTSSGAWLDGWVRVEQVGICSIFYQVEVKTWSFHGYGGGEQLKVSCTPDELKEFKKSEWAKYWDFAKCRFKAQGLDKVVKKMRPPGNRQGINIQPLACLWAAVHPNGEETPFFEVEVKNADFGKVSVFSVSSFLRKHLQQSECIDLELPNTRKRLEYLNKIFIANASGSGINPLRL